MYANERLEGSTAYQNTNRISLGRCIICYFYLLLYTFLLLSFCTVNITAFFDQKQNILLNNCINIGKTRSYKEE